MRALARLQPVALMLLRVLVGITMVYYSWSKVYPSEGLLHAWHRHHLLASVEHFNDYVVTLHLPRWLGYISTTTEFLGGLCLIFGLLTRFWGFLIAINMLVALVAVNIHHGFPGSQFSLALIAMAFMLITAGSGSYSLDRRFGIP